MRKMIEAAIGCRCTQRDNSVASTVLLAIVHGDDVADVRRGEPTGVCASRSFGIVVVVVVVVVVVTV